MVFWTAVRKAIALPCLALAWLTVAASSCTGLREDSDAGTAPSASVPAERDAAPQDGDTTPDDAATTDARSPLGTYDEVQRTLEALRSPGPVTAQGSRGTCTDSYFTWRDLDGTIHAWSGATQARIDYPYKAPRAPFVPSDENVPVDTATFSELSVYRTDGVGAKLAGLAYATYYWATNDGVLRLDQTIDNVDQGGTKIRQWVRATGTTVDVTQVLPTRQPPSSYAEGRLVVPGSTVIPFPLYVVDVASKTTTSVTFDGAIGLRETLPMSLGLLVAYARTGPTSALRLHKGYRDADRVEVGDEIANRPNLFSDTSADEHKLLSRIASYGKWVVYDSSIGVFAFHLETGRIVPVQLGAGKKIFVVDVMCVMPTSRTLVYRKLGDTVGQIWTVPLDRLLPP